MKKGFVANIERETVENTYFRRVLYTGKLQPARADVPEARRGDR